MTFRLTAIFILALFAFGFTGGSSGAMTTASRPSGHTHAGPCSGFPVAVQVLGSGEPMHGDGRGSAAYVLWVKQRPVVVVDMGGDAQRPSHASGWAPVNLTPCC